jgi:hypothetical protein
LARNIGFEGERFGRKYSVPLEMQQVLTKQVLEAIVKGIAPPAQDLELKG